MRLARWFGWVGVCSVLAWSSHSPGQVIPAPPWLGLVDSRTAEVEVFPGCRPWGVELLGVVPGSPAGRAGLNPGDVILTANGRRVTTPDELRGALASSGPRLRLQVFEGQSGQVLNRVAQVRPNAFGPAPATIAVVGRIRAGVVAIGGETTGTTLTDANGRTFDLEFGAARPPLDGADGRVAAVSGLLKAGGGPERPGRRVILVDFFRLVGDRPNPGEGRRASPF